ncbi:MAG: AbrB family transcriptional regulator [Actinomycetota bacterium]|nr:AbrB family transcriptional regulator [Actinomycetota bacterium]
MGYRLPVPAGVLTGTLLAVGTVSIGVSFLGLPQLPIPSWVRYVLQVLLGMMVGLRMDRETLRSGMHALIPASLLAAILILTTVAAALLTAPLTSADLVTILFAAAPGGLTEMSLISMNFGADAAGVAAVQLVRVLVALAVIDVLLSRFGPKGQSEPASDDQEEEQEDIPAKAQYQEGLKRFGAAAPWGILGGAIGIISPVPAGGIIGALVGCAAYRLLTGSFVPMKRFRIGVQTLAGGVIGLEISTNFFSELLRLAGAGALIILAQMLLWFLMSWLLVRFFHYDLSTAALASSPGGLSGVVPAAGEAGADEVVVTFIHLVRLSVIVAVVPLVVVLFFGG